MQQKRERAESPFNTREIVAKRYRFEEEAKLALRDIPEASRGKFECKTCFKFFRDRKTFDKHRKTKEHKQNEKDLRYATFYKQVQESWVGNDDRVLSLKVENPRFKEENTETCQECDKEFDSVEACLAHGKKVHGGFTYHDITDEEYRVACNFLKRHMRYKDVEVHDRFYQSHLQKC